MQPSSNFIRVLATAAVLAALGGCSEYLDHRESISVKGGDAVATDVATQMVDPWPRDSADRNIAFNGAKMETAVERYRTNKVIPPRGIGTSGSYQGAGGSADNTTPLGPTVTAPAAPVK